MVYYLALPSEEERDAWLSALSPSTDVAAGVMIQRQLA